VSGAARVGARQAMVHGKLAPPKLNAWGPSQVSGNGNGSHELIQAIKPHLHGLDASNVTITAQWLDASNDVGARVRVTVSTPYSPTLTSLFGNLTLTLRATSTVPIAH
jgi:hypothetical protein